VSDRKKLRVLIVDDNAEDRRRMKAIFARRVRFSASAVAPPVPLDAASFLDQESTPDLVLVDYQLSEKEADRAAATYKGSTLAAALRERLPKTPILLITRATLLTSGKAAGARDLQGAFESLVVKDDIWAQPAIHVERFRLLAEGFRTVGDSTSKDWAGLRSLLGAEREEDELLREADPPQHVLEGKSWRVTEVARWITGTLLKYPGILYAPLHAATTLGISVETFLWPTIQKRFRPALYSGVFRPEEPFVWRGRLHSIARDVLRKAGKGDEPLTSFAAAWAHLHRRRPDPAVCVTSGETPADSVCYVLCEPVMRRYSLPYRPDSRPACMDEARVSFAAIRKTNEYEDQLFPADARALLPHIEKNEL
jgi:CheY-like chemotaxis protein